MTRQQAVEFVRSSGGRIVGVEFVKRTDGTLRRMSCRLGVVSYLLGDLGSGAAYDPAAHGLIRVFDMHRQGYRSVPVEGITAISVNGTWERITDSPDNPVE